MLRLNNALFLPTAILVSLAASAQEAVFRSDTRLVVLHASVADRNGKLVTNLPQKAFRVFENNAEQQIRFFRREDIPVSLGLVIDNSASMRPRREMVERAALNLVKESNREDQVFIVNFNDEAYLDAPFTNSLEKLEEGLERIDQRGGTAMRDAISMSIDYMKEEGKLDKRVILAVTDGDDNASSMNLEQLVKKAQQSEVLIYVIGLLSDEDRSSARRARRAITAICESSGGAAYFPKDLAEVNELASTIAHELRNQYTIADTPSNSTLDGTYLTIRVRVDGPGSPVARTRTGYYATPDPVAPKPPAAPAPSQ